MLGHSCLGEAEHFVKSVIAEDGHETRNDKLSDTSISAVLDPLVE